MHSIVAASRSRLSETGPKLLCSKLPVMLSVCDSAFNQSFRKINVNTVKHVLLYRINSSCKLFLLMYTFIIFTMR